MVGFGYIRGTDTSGQILVNSAGEVTTWCNKNDPRYFSGFLCFVVEQHSVSQDTGWIKLYTGYNGLIKYRATLNTCCLMVCGLYGFTTGYAVPNELPNEYLPTCEPLYCPLYMRQSNNTAGIWIPQRDSSDRKFYLYSGIQTNVATSIGGFVYWTIQ